jgi:hypothetical protein
MNKPSRRAVVRTGVWAVPVVATAAAVPAFATGSGPSCTTDGKVCVEGVGTGCKLPGESTHNGATYFGYRMVVTFDNTTTSDITIHLDDFQISGKPTTGFPKDTDLTLSPGQNPELYIVTSSASSQRSATIFYTYLGQSVSATVTFDTFNPCKCDPKDADPTDPKSDCS